MVRRSLSTPIVLVLLFMAHGPLSRSGGDAGAGTVTATPMVDERADINSGNARTVVELAVAVLQVLQALDQATQADPVLPTLARARLPGQEVSTIETCARDGSYHMTASDNDGNQYWSSGDSLHLAFSRGCINGAGQAVEGIRHVTVLDASAQSIRYQLQLDSYRISLGADAHMLSGSSLLVSHNQRQLGDGSIWRSRSYTPDTGYDVASGFVHSQWGALRLMNYTFVATETALAGQATYQRSWGLAPGQPAVLASPEYGGFDLAGVRPFISRSATSAPVDGELHIVGRNGNRVRVQAEADGRMRYFTHIYGVTSGPFFYHPQLPALRH